MYMYTVYRNVKQLFGHISIVISVSHTRTFTTMYIHTRMEMDTNY